ncbi:MAG: hypothetical protein EBQ85_12090 [Proteobacteria bacterium]|nr:hypothetical protein [Pseudomonadota bacterium]
MELTRETFHNEIKNFRSQMKPEAVSLAEQSLFLEKKGSVGVIVFDQAGEKANKLSSANMIRFFELLCQAESDPTIKALVVISKKPSIFIAGADIGEIRTLASGSTSADSLMKLQSVFTYLENLPIPSIAAIHGASMGGGTELALGCDYRMATDSPQTKIGLPEVMLGLIPGWGGTQRMPRLIGLEKSLDLILTGKTVDSGKAKKMGLVDKIVPAEYLEERAIAWANELAQTGKKRVYETRSLKEKILGTVPGGTWLVCDQARKQVMEKTKGNFPAPLKAIEVIRKTYGGPIDKGLKVEAEAFIELMVTPESQNLIHVFYLNEGVKKDKGVEGKVSSRTVGHAAVIGAGVMGGGIAQLFAAKGVRVRLKDVNWDAIMKGYHVAKKIFQKSVDRRKMKSSDLDNAMARIEGTTQYTGFGKLDLVVEAAVENMEVKKSIFKQLEEKVAETTFLATNTSSLSVTELASVTRHPQRVVGMHFFNPVDKMLLVEVIRGAQTSDEAVATLVAFSKVLGKTPIVVKDSPGFVVNRILGPYLNEAIHLLMEGVRPREMDAVIEQFGMPMGPCALIDEVGLDVASKVSQVLYGAFGERMKPPATMAQVVEQKRLGKKVGKGIYIHNNNERHEDEEMLKVFGTKPRATDLTDEVVQRRLIYLMINEASRCVEEGLVRQVSDIDVGMIFGTGFAPFRGGLLKYADSLGAETILSDLDVFVRKYGNRFQPSKLLQELAVNKKKFYDTKESHQ